MNKEDLLKIINTYGVMPQLKYFQSEIFELNEAIIKLEQFYTDVANEDDCYEVFIKDEVKRKKEHIVEEIADVCVMLEQFRHYYNISNKQLEEVMKFKIYRQLERIKHEKDNKNN